MNEKETIYFLHEMGYTLFTVGGLTYPEINALVEVSNKKIKEKERAQKRAQQKAKRPRRR